MMIGKGGEATTAISTADATSVTVRGKSLTDDLMGRLSFTVLVTSRPITLPLSVTSVGPPFLYRP